MAATFQELSARVKLDLICPEKQMLDLTTLKVQNRSVHSQVWD